MKLKGNICKPVVRPAVVYEGETRVTTKAQEARIETNEMDVWSKKEM